MLQEVNEFDEYSILTLTYKVFNRAKVVARKSHGFGFTFNLGKHDATNCYKVAFFFTFHSFSRLPSMTFLSKKKLSTTTVRLLYIYLQYRTSFNEVLFKLR